MAVPTERGSHDVQPGVAAVTARSRVPEWTLDLPPGIEDSLEEELSYLIQREIDLEILDTVARTELAPQGWHAVQWPSGADDAEILAWLETNMQGSHRRLRLEKEERANREAREKRERRNREVILALDTIKSRITRSIEEGSIPNPMRLPRLLEQGLNRHNTYINNPGHQDYGLWQSQMETWAHEQGLELTVVADHDGMGIESWLNLVVKPL